MTIMKEQLMWLPRHWGKTGKRLSTGGNQKKDSIFKVAAKKDKKDFWSCVYKTSPLVCSFRKC